MWKGPGFDPQALKKWGEGQRANTYPYTIMPFNYSFQSSFNFDMYGEKQGTKIGI